MAETWFWARLVQWLRTVRGGDMVNQLSHFVACVLSHFTCIQPFATLWTVAHQVPLSMGFPREEYWNEVPFPPPGDLPNSRIELTSLMSPALTGRFFITSATWKALN